MVRLTRLEIYIIPHAIIKYAENENPTRFTVMTTNKENYFKTSLA